MATKKIVKKALRREVPEETIQFSEEVVKQAKQQLLQEIAEILNDLDK